MICSRLLNGIFCPAAKDLTTNFPKKPFLCCLTKITRPFSAIASEPSMTPTRSAIDNFHIKQLQSGLFLFKRALTEKQQTELAEIALERGNKPENGFWKIDELGNRVLNQAPKAPHRGRVFDALTNFPEMIAMLGKNCLQQAANANHTIKNIEATHVIMLYYQTLSQAPKNGYINWHQDKDPNDGDGDLPVVSFALGDSCDFLVCNEKPSVKNYDFANPVNLAHRILFESGDVLIFGGRSRYIHHAIHNIHKNTAPSYLPFRDARLNFTFRYAPQIIGKEADFASSKFKSVYHST